MLEKKHSYDIMHKKCTNNTKMEEMYLKGRRVKKREKNLKMKKKAILNIFIIFFLGMFIYSGFNILTYFIDSYKNKKATQELTSFIDTNNGEKQAEGDVDENNSITIDFPRLKEKNSDVVAFIKVNGVSIEQIVVKGTDNSYYLNHGFNKERNAAGWIFADYRNKFDGTDKNIIIYGHNMRNGTMFANLKNVLNNEWKDNQENRYISFVTEQECSTYEVFSVYQIKDESYYLTTEFREGEFGEFIKTLKSRSKYNFSVDVSESDQIITLSTCANDNRYRVVLHAKRVI